ncbi:MAG: prepilin-type N-terminal cleavage/methylation domain-containing protein [Pirellulales bacterium]
MFHNLRKPRRVPATMGHRAGLTLVELLIAVSILTLIAGVLGGLSRAVQMGFDYSQGHGMATQHARVTIERITRIVNEAVATEDYPGAWVVDEAINATSYPDALVVWRPANRVPANPAGPPRFSELVIFAPDPAAPSRLVEFTVPNDIAAVPPLSDTTAWRAAVDTIRHAGGATKTVLTDLVSASAASGSTLAAPSGLRFESTLRPSAAEWAEYKLGTRTWKNLTWAQGVYGSKTGLRQAWVRLSLQLVPGTTVEAGQVDPFFGSAALYYEMHR